jgi:hypothetical protein
MATFQERRSFKRVPANTMTSNRYVHWYSEREAERLLD